MRIRSWHLDCSAAALLGLTQAASAQRAVFNPYPSIPPTPVPFGPNAQPVLSPFLNLLRGGDPAVNYFLDVVPALQKQNQQQQPTIAAPKIDVKLDEQFQEAVGRPPLRATGHSTGFLTPGWRSVPCRASFSALVRLRSRAKESQRIASPRCSARCCCVRLPIRRS